MLNLAKLQYRTYDLIDAPAGFVDDVFFCQVTKLKHSNYLLQTTNSFACN